MNDFHVEIDGLDVLEKKIRSLLSAVEAKEVEDVLLKGAQIIRDDAKRRVNVKTGNLKRSIKAKKGKPRSRAYATAFAATDRKIASHGHLVEYGHALVKGGKKIGHVSAKPFFRPAIESSKAQVKSTVEQGLKQIIEGAIK